MIEDLLGGNVQQQTITIIPIKKNLGRPENVNIGPMNPFALFQRKLNI